MKIIKKTKNPNFKTFKDICTVQQGLQINKDERFNTQVENSLPYITIQSLKNGNEFDEFIKEARNSVICNTNDILVARTGSVGKIVTNQHGVFHNNFFKLNLHLNYDSNYVYNVLNGHKSQFDIKRLAGVTTIPDIKHSDFFRVKILDVELEEQIKIGNALSQQEDQVNNIKTLIEKLEKRNQYYAKRLLSGDIRVRECDDGKVEFYKNEDWKEIKVGDKTKLIPNDWDFDKIENYIIENPKSTIGAKKANIDGIYPFYNCSKTQSLLINDFNIEKPSILLSTGGVAAVHYSEHEKYAYSSDVYSVCIKTLNEKFIAYHLKNSISELNSYFQGAAIKHLSKKQFKTMHIPVIKNSEANLINKAIDMFSKESEKAHLLLEKEQKRLDWMSYALLSGEYQIVD